MNRLHGKEGCQLAIHLLDAQLRALSMSVSLASQLVSSDGNARHVAASFSKLKRKGRPHTTGSGGNIAINDNQIDGKSAFNTDSDALDRMPLQENEYLRIVTSNALLAARSVLIEHHTDDLRTPEIQFIRHVCDAILNDNIFDIEPGYMPIATFDGLKIDSALNGHLLFGDGITENFMEYGDAVALLDWLSHYLRGERNFVTGGDAG